MDQKAEKSFIISNEAWYCQRTKTRLLDDEVIIGKYYKDGSTAGEFSVVWDDIAPKLEVYQGAWVTLSEMPELIEMLSELDKQNITPTILANKLTELGYNDITERNLKL